MSHTEPILDFRVTTKNMEGCATEITSWLSKKDRPRYLVCANPHSIEVAVRDDLFHTALKSADLSLPDGVGIVYASMILGGRIRKRITGSDIFHALSERLNRDSCYSYSFLGSTEVTLSAIKEKMAKEYPKIRFAGSYSPPFKERFSESDNQVIIDAINRARADVLWVGMTAPKQEKWIYQHKDKLNVKFIGAIGAVFTFMQVPSNAQINGFNTMVLNGFPAYFENPDVFGIATLFPIQGFWCVLLHRLIGRGGRA